MKKIFISYSHQDEKYRVELGKQLKIYERNGTITIWHDRKIGGGEEWKNAIHANLESADIILLLVSSDFINSDYCFDLEMRRALERHDGGSAVVVPIIVRPCKWNKAIFSKLQAVPTDNKSIKNSRDKDSAWVEVVTKIEDVIDRLNSKPSPNVRVGSQPAIRVLHTYSQSWLKILREPGARNPIEDLRLDRYVWPRLSWEVEVSKGGDKIETERRPIPGQGKAITNAMLKQLIQERIVVLYDDAGMGKTAFTHQCLDYLLERNLSSGGNTNNSASQTKTASWAEQLVVRLEGKWPKKNSQYLTVRELLIEQVLRCLCPDVDTTPDKSLEGLVVQAVADSLRERRVIVLVDAFDQMSTDDREQVLKTISSNREDIASADPDASRCAWLITSRQYAVKPVQSRLPTGTLHLRLERFSPEEQDAYFDDLAREPFFQQIGQKPLDWICCPRANLAEDLSLPFNLRMIRRRLEQFVKGSAGSSKATTNGSTIQFSTTGELHAAVARDLLEQAIKREDAQIDAKEIARPAGQPPEPIVRIESLFVICGLLAIQMMLENRWNASVDEHDNTADDRMLGINGVEDFLSRVKSRFLIRFRDLTSTRSATGKLPPVERMLQAEKLWDWAIALLSREEVTHRGDIYTFNKENRSFRDLKTMEWYAAHYLMNYVTAAELTAAIEVHDIERGSVERRLCDVAFDEKWLSNCWRLAIDMPRGSVKDTSAIQTLALLFQRPPSTEGNQRRPCEHMYLAWERWLEPREAGVKVLPGAQEVIEVFRSEYAALLAANDRSAKEIAEGFIAIPVGTFQMGSPEEEKGRDNDETRREVTIKRQFSLHRFPVTNAEYELFDSSHGERRSKSSPGADHPVVQVSWYEAWCFSRWVSLSGGECRLPTEAEWEYACRAGSPDAYCFGDDESELGDYAWYSANSNGQTQPVGGKKANAWGLYDMHGNVWEWCQDWYGDYDATQTSDPVGPSKGSRRVYRGGGWGDGAASCRSAFRSGDDPTYRGRDLGFRLALSPLEPS